MRRLRTNLVLTFLFVVPSAVSAQPLEPLEADVEDIAFGTWVQASISLDSALYEEDVAKALRRCTQSMFTVEDELVEAMFPSADDARGDLSVFPFEDGVIVAQAGATTPVPTRLAAGQLRSGNSLMLRLSTTAFWNGWDRRWIEMTFATPIWADMYFTEAERDAHHYTLLMLMRYNGETGVYVKCEE